MADDTIILRIYRAPNGQWSGKLFAGDEELGAIAGCESAEDVEQQAIDCGLHPDRVEVEAG
ncbi:hypothetical protein AWB73_06024 [Caballeronia turbans]|jgi:hypothetical protein|uniref:hypothetical protein n=1 Tax=Caballeronia sp. INML2 TaxID=2921748 RepID=UPI00074B9499|nr:hypothetical protein [Caballeronia sp. INML2]SAL55258.1 hypothetical protein AWB73_06024 [Caballeronia turbans]